MKNRMWHSMPFLFLLSLTASAFCQSWEGHSWKSFSAPILSGGRFTISGNSRSPVLLAFLALGPNANQSQSRAAAVVLTSIDYQYRDRGLQTVAVDTSPNDSHRSLRHEDLINRVADWNLNFPILEDLNDGYLEEHGVRIFPTIVLIGAGGREIERWEGYPRTSSLALAIEHVLGGPLSNLPSSSLNHEDHFGADSDNSVPRNDERHAPMPLKATSSNHTDSCRSSRKQIGKTSSQDISPNSAFQKVQ